MTLDERNKRIRIFFQECLDIIEKKGRDYSPDGTAFTEWDEAAADMGISWRQLIGVYARKHWSAFMSWVKKGRVESEPIRERMKDLANYMALTAVKLESEAEKGEWDDDDV